MGSVENFAQHFETSLNIFLERKGSLNRMMTMSQNRPTQNLNVPNKSWKEGMGINRMKRR